MYWYNNYWYWPERNFQTMYPEIYQELYPYIKKKCNELDYAYGYMMYSFPKEEEIDQIVEEVYNEYMNAIKDKKKDDKTLYRSRYNHDDGFLKDIVKILILKELLTKDRCRRCRRRRRYHCPYDCY